MKFICSSLEIHTPQTDQKHTLKFIHPSSKIHTPQTDQKDTLRFIHFSSEIHTLQNRSKRHLEIHPFFIGNSYPGDGSKTHLEIHLSVVGNSYPENSSQIHTSRIHTFIVGNFDFIRLMDEFQAPWVPQWTIGPMSINMPARNSEFDQCILLYPHIQWKLLHALQEVLRILTADLES